jgi:UDP-N-acetyl-D-glucosamine dehydrogenase
LSEGPPPEFGPKLSWRNALDSPTATRNPSRELSQFDKENTMTETHVIDLRADRAESGDPSAPSRVAAPRLVPLAERIRTREAVIGVIGQGYVGFPLAQRSAASGFRSYGFDIAEHVVDGCNTLNQEADYSATSDTRLLERCDVILIAVPTPTIETAEGRREPSVELVRSAMRDVVTHALEQDPSRPRLIVVESTYAPGTTRNEIAPMLGFDRLGRDLALGYSPERIDPGNRHFNLDNIPKVVSGYDESSASLTELFYAQILGRVVPSSSMEAAELTKILENVFRFVNITFAQEFEQYCERIGVSAREVTELASTKPFGFMPFFAGAGIGGHCIAEDPYFLFRAAEHDGVRMGILDAAISNHEGRSHVIADRARQLLGGSVEGRKIMLLGVSYKPDIADSRRTPAAELLQLLEQAGATVDYHDPHVPEYAGRRSAAVEDVDPRSYDLAILVTKHSAFENGPFARAEWPVYDTSDTLATGFDQRVVTS